MDPWFYGGKTSVLSPHTEEVLALIWEEWAQEFQRILGNQNLQEHLLRYLHPVCQGHKDPDFGIAHLPLLSIQLSLKLSYSNDQMLGLIFTFLCLPLHEMRVCAR